MKVLVTGGAGYVGSVATEELIRAGHEVVVFDNLSQGHREAVHPRAKFVTGDLAKPEHVAAVFVAHQPEAVMHFAARSLVGESMQKPFLYLGENVINGLNLLHATVEHGVKRFIFSSTANLFDNPAKIPIDEEAMIIPGSPYGESKFIIERMLFWLEKTHGLHYACLRYFNAAGGTQECGEDHNPETHLIPIVLQVALGKREKVTVFGTDYPTRDGSCVRDYVHVVDLAQAHILTLEALDRGSRTYNLGNGHGFSVKEVIEMGRLITGHGIPAEFGPRRAGDVATLVAGSDKIRGELGWKPKFADLRAIMEGAWNWHRRFPNGYGRPDATRRQAIPALINRV
jgi:UDP-glucose 4-epimerase